MCGIFGVVGSDLPGERDFASGLASIAHRGPDHSSIHRGRGFVFGHNRLSIIDLSDGSNQPFVTERSVLVFNGEIYNFRALREELSRAGVVFSTDGDTEVVARACEHWGTDGIARLDGMFAFALFDLQSGACHLARDSFGIKPLYVRQRGDTVAFASEVKPLLCLEPAEVDPRVLEEICVWGFPLSQNSFYASVSQVVPGTVVTVHGGAVTSRPFHGVSQHPKRSGAERELGPALERSVVDHMVADVPVAIALSGGLDSSVIAALAARHVAKPVAFTTTFSDTEDDEVRYARLVARHCGIEHHVVKLDVPDFEERLATIVAHAEEPIANPNLFPTYGLSKTIREAGFKVVLMGEGSDEIFAGYPWHRAATRLRATNASMYEHYRARRGQTGMERFLQPDVRRSVDGRDAQFRASFDASGRGSRLDRMLAFERAFQLQFAQLLRVDKMMMAHSVEARVPFLYPSVLEAANRLPDRRKLNMAWWHRGRDNKIALAALAGRLLPAAVVERPKFGKSGTVNLWNTPLMADLLPVSARMLDSTEYREAREYLSRWIDWPKVVDVPRKQLFTLMSMIMACHLHVANARRGHA